MARQGMQAVVQEGQPSPVKCGRQVPGSVAALLHQGHPAEAALRSADPEGHRTVEIYERLPDQEASPGGSWKTSNGAELCIFRPN